LLEDAAAAAAGRVVFLLAEVACHLLSQGRSRTALVTLDTPPLGLSNSTPSAWALPSS